MSSLDRLCLLPSEEQDEILNGPALAPPSGVTPNFQNPPNLTIVAKVITPILFALVAILVLLRFSSKVVAQRSVHIEDVLCFLGFGTYIGYVWCIYEGVRVIGLYVHQWDVNVQSVLDMLHVFQYFVNFYSMTILFMKAAILLEWVRIFAPPGSSRGAFYRACQVIFVITLLFYVSTQIAGNLTCRPLESRWNPRICGKCFDRAKMDMAVGAMNITSHLCILILPQGIIWKLQLPLRKKMGIAIVFMFGILAIVCASFRLAATVNYSFADDWTYNVSPLALWCLAELTCLFIVFCVPGVPKAFQMFRSWSYNRSSQRPSNNASNILPPWPTANSNSLKPLPYPRRPIDDARPPLQIHKPTHSLADSRDKESTLRASESSEITEGKKGWPFSNRQQLEYQNGLPGMSGDSQRAPRGMPFPLEAAYHIC